ncbi:MAG: hypothetical protein WKF37_24700 [Bryobacteraceae bacterium]
MHYTDASGLAQIVNIPLTRGGAVDIGAAVGTLMDTGSTRFQ